MPAASCPSASKPFSEPFSEPGMGLPVHEASRMNSLACSGYCSAITHAAPSSARNHASHSLANAASSAVPPPSAPAGSDPSARRAWSRESSESTSQAGNSAPPGCSRGTHLWTQRVQNRSAQRRVAALSPPGAQVPGMSAPAPSSESSVAARRIQATSCTGISSASTSLDRSGGMVSSIEATARSPEAPPASCCSWARARSTERNATTAAVAQSCRSVGVANAAVAALVTATAAFKSQGAS
mmetsp:Transcript_76515/g.200730  ORF Transcript_76515/g.200730 Transcript_76515/m.200730 type:complete len:241 (-) Transcript_76515:932-1654(-)